ncbi:MAG: hypothetical protein RI933_1043 [Actinomycetota bacterium]
MSDQADIQMVQSAQQATQLAAYFRDVWGGQDDVVPPDLQLALLHVGAYAALAKINGEVVGGSFGVRGVADDKDILHSHVTAASIRGVGWQLKMHQASWVRELGLDGITWTFDPLVRRNCVFNFEKLGATAKEYLPNFYGTMTDDINRGDESDRLFVFWDMQSEPENSPEEVGLTTNIAVQNHGGLPQLQSFDSTRQFLVELPEDIEALRRDNLEAALRWRKTVREVLQPAFAAGARISNMTADRSSMVIDF